LTVKVEALPYVPVFGSGSAKTQVRDRQWTFKHAKEMLANGESTVSDLASIRDRIPHSQRGTVLRKRINVRIAQLSDTFNPIHMDT
jgi:hypothetical protein